MAWKSGRAGWGAFIFVSAAVVALFATTTSASALSLGLQWTGNYEESRSAPAIEAIGRSGADLFRVPMAPGKSANGADWGYYDAVFGEAAKNGVTILPQFGGRVDGALGVPAGNAEKANWSAWAKEAVCRYGYKGAFWSLHPEFPAKPAIAWEMWNEENNPGIEGHENTATEYGNFLSWAGVVVQNASESCGGQKTGVLFGGLLDNAEYLKYLETAYKIASGAITGVALHPYALGPTTAKARMEKFEKTVNDTRNRINSLGGSGKSLWITEMGWPVAVKFIVTEAEQAELLKASVDWSKGQEAALNLRSYIWYNYRDFPFLETWEYHCGLRRAAPAERFSQSTFRPAWRTFQEENGKPVWPVAPGAETQAATNIRSTEATLNGMVNPHGLPTGYHFEWAEGGEGFSHWLPSQDIEAGWKEGYISESQTLTGLKPNTTYHFRMVGTNENHEFSFGANFGFTTLPGGPALTITSDNRLYASTPGARNSLLSAERQSSWAWQKPMSLAVADTTYSKPAAIMDSEKLLVFAQGPTNTLIEKVRDSDGSWHGPYQVGGPGAAYSAPAVAKDAWGNIFVVAEGANHTLQETQRYGDLSWHGPYEVGTPGAAYSAPAMVIDTHDNLFVVAEGANHTLQETQRYGDWSWHGPYEVGTPGAAYSPPAMVLDASDNLFVVAEGANGGLQEAQRYGDWSWHGPYEVVVGGTTPQSGFSPSTWSIVDPVNFADANGDGRADIIGRNFGGNVEVGLSTGGSFAVSKSWASNWSTSYSAVFADVSGDGRADIIGRNSTGDVGVGLSTGSAFGTRTSWGPWSSAYSLAFADVNGDQRADIIGRNSAGEVQVGLSTGGSFAMPSKWSTWNPGYSMEFADVNADGRADIIGRGPTGDVQAGVSTGSAFSISSAWMVWPNSYSIQFADMNGDGKADVAGRYVNSNEVRVEIG